ncbi:MAG: hypothetical protein Q7K16_00545 [Candidatus Azambacteria bacterium]|nr:hypothetical protein [Candidatus Azambacteria bacterium]
MNNTEKKSNMPTETAPKNKLEIFRDEIAIIKETEMDKKKDWENRGHEGEAYNPHFDTINPEYLGETEREVYEKYKNDNLTVEEFRALKSEAIKEYEKLPAGDKKSTSGDFWAYVANLVNTKDLRRQLEEMRRKKNQ